VGTFPVQNAGSNRSGSTPPHDGSKVSDLTRRLIDYELPTSRLPLCDERHPFRDLPVDTVSTIARRALRHPELRGRLTDSVREVNGGTAPKIDNFVVFEAHIDLTELDPDLNLQLLSAGFEPDDFAKMEPEEYRHHFTLQYMVPMPSTRLGTFEREVSDAAAEAARVIDEHGQATGYVEIETYRSKYVTKLPWNVLSSSATIRTPLSSDFELRCVPATHEESVSSGLPLDVRRAADIHVKIPGGFLSYDGTPASVRLSNADDSQPTGRQHIKKALEDRNFYEIISQGGNYLYSAHFSDLGEANAAYWELVAYARECGEITGVVREACTNVWRKSTVSASGMKVLARVPPLLRASWSCDIKTSQLAQP